MRHTATSRATQYAFRFHSDCAQNNLPASLRRAERGKKAVGIKRLLTKWLNNTPGGPFMDSDVSRSSPVPSEERPHDSTCIKEDLFFWLQYFTNYKNPKKDLETTHRHSLPTFRLLPAISAQAEHHMAQWETQHEARSIRPSPNCPQLRAQQSERREKHRDESGKGQTAGKQLKGLRLRRAGWKGRVLAEIRGPIISTPGRSAKD